MKITPDLFDLLRQLAFHFAFPHQFKTKVEKKRFRGRKIIDDDTHVIYSMNLHISYSSCSCASIKPRAAAGLDNWLRKPETAGLP
jgi:hypothetical protein